MHCVRSNLVSNEVRAYEQGNKEFNHIKCLYHSLSHLAKREDNNELILRLSCAHDHLVYSSGYNLFVISAL